MYKDNNQFYEHSSHTTLPITSTSETETETEWGMRHRMLLTRKSHHRVTTVPATAVSLAPDFQHIGLIVRIALRRGIAVYLVFEPH